MSIVDRINNQAMQMGVEAKMSVQSFFFAFCRLISGSILGLTFSLMGQEVFKYGPLLFWFVIVSTVGAFYRLSRNWSGIGLFIIDLLCVLCALLIRMYVVIAPG